MARAGGCSQAISNLLGVPFQTWGTDEKKGPLFPGRDIDRLCCLMLFLESPHPSPGPCSLGLSPQSSGSLVQGLRPSKINPDKLFTLNLLKVRRVHFSGGGEVTNPVLAKAGIPDKLGSN